jgi:hypothetical protein
VPTHGKQAHIVESRVAATELTVTFRRRYAATAQSPIPTVGWRTTAKFLRRYAADVETRNTKTGASGLCERPKQS